MIQRIQRARRRSSDRRSGVAMVEMAVVLPIFFMVVLGIIEFGRAMMVGQMITNAAREGTRLAIIDGSTNTSVETWIDTFLSDTLNANANDISVTITIVAAPGNPDPANQLAAASPRDLVTVQVDVPFDKVSYLPGDYLGGKNLTAKSSMRHE